jgi:hypothetical protein
MLKGKKLAARLPHFEIVERPADPVDVGVE